MSAYPCQRCGGRIVGEAKNAYLTLFEGETKASFRYVICLNCQNELVAEWLGRALRRDQDGDWVMSMSEGDDAVVWVSVDGGWDRSKTRSQRR